MLRVLFTHPTVIAVDIVALGLLVWFWIGSWSFTGKILVTIAILLYLGANHWRLMSWMERPRNGESALPKPASGAYTQFFLFVMLIAAVPLFLSAGAWSVIERRKRSARRRPRPWRTRQLLWLAAVGSVVLAFVVAAVAVVVHTVVSGAIPAAWLAAAIAMGILIALATSLGIR